VNLKWFEMIGKSTIRYGKDAIFSQHFYLAWPNSYRQSELDIREDLAIFIVAVGHIDGNERTDFANQPIPEN